MAPMSDDAQRVYYDYTDLIKDLDPYALYWCYGKVPYAQVVDRFMLFHESENLSDVSSDPFLVFYLYYKNFYDDVTLQEAAHALSAVLLDVYVQYHNKVAFIKGTNVVIC
ncbi:hypothetical protein [Sicyoidochytrium minutum DNA virus]|nr:hypothetical protein [Sicyoidochytrium minutum DNA virus]